MKSSSSSHDGENLIADFQSAFIAIATSEAAKREAKISEDQLVSQLSGWSNEGFLNTGGIEKTLEENVGRSSLDAHVKKVQAGQIESLTSEQLTTLTKENRDKFIGCKVEINSLNTKESPFDVLWFDPHTGYRSNVYNKKKIVGRIKEILPGKNMIIIEPGKLSKLVNKDLEGYVVYVIDPATAEPMISLTVL